MPKTLLSNPQKKYSALIFTQKSHCNHFIFEIQFFCGIISLLKKLDYSDGNPDLSEKDCKLLNQIREIRNYWCHQCYIDYVYINDDNEREKKFQQIANRLHYDENRT